MIALVTCLVHYRRPTKSCSVTFSPAHPIAESSPVHDIVSQTTLGLWLRQKPDNRLFFFFFLPLWAGPVPRYFQGTAALLPGAVRANTGSIFYEAASLRACVARSCAGKCPRPGATKQHFWSEAVAAIVRSATVELSREGSWCRCFGQISAMQLVFVFN